MIVLFLFFGYIFGGVGVWIVVKKEGVVLFCSYGIYVIDFWVGLEFGKLK